MGKKLIKDLEIGSAQLLTPVPEPILYATTITTANNSYAVWHTVPTSSEEEAVFISRIPSEKKRDVEIQYVGEGADPDCLITESEIYVSWVKKDFSTGLWTVNISIFDKELNSVSTRSLVAGVRNIFGKPHLVKIENEIVLIYFNDPIKNHIKIHTYYLHTDKATVQKVSINSPQDTMVRYSDRCVVAVIEGKDLTSVLTFNEDRWNPLSSFTKESDYPYRFDLALDDTSAMFVVTFGHDRIATLALNLSDGSVGEKWAICDYGKFASIASADGHWIVSWVGAPAMPLPDQGKEYSDRNMVPFALAVTEIREEVAEIEKIEGVTRNRSEMEELWGVTSVGPWAPLWLGILNREGKCIQTYGLLGVRGDENWGTQLSTGGGRGALLWRSYERFEESPQDCFLNSREFFY